MSLPLKISAHEEMIGTKRGFSLARREEITGWLFITPMLIGFIVFSFGPILASLIISFTDWDLLQAPKFVGFVQG